MGGFSADVLDRLGATAPHRPAPTGAAPTVDDVRRIAAVSDPVVRNLQITQAYHELSAALARLTGAGANWCTLATWASRQAGQSIRREDLLAAFKRLLVDAPEIRERADALLHAGRAINGEQQLESFIGALDVLWDAVNPAAAFQRTSDAVARGNLKVFAEIGAEFARFLDLFADGGRPVSEAGLAAFAGSLRPGDPPDGQGYLQKAFEHYVQALRSADLKQRAQLLLLANLEIGYHEQTRLQPEIIEAMNAPVVDPRALHRRLVAELFPNRASQLRYWLAGLAGRLGPLFRGRDQLAEEVQSAGRRVITATLMTLALPTGQVLQLDRALPATSPELLDTSDLPELAAFLARVGAAPDRPAGAGVHDWGDLTQRMRFIADLFRTYHLTPALFASPFEEGQVAVIRAGERPAGRL